MLSPSAPFPLCHLQPFDKLVKADKGAENGWIHPHVRPVRIIDASARSLCRSNPQVHVVPDRIHRRVARSRRCAGIGAGICRRLRNREEDQQDGREGKQGINILHIHVPAIQRDNGAKYQEKEKGRQDEIDELPTENNFHIVPGQADGVLYGGSEG